jgi:uncharacterized DUF497 family protein
MEVEYDPAKRAATIASRGLDMALAGEAFENEHTTRPDDRRDYGEERFLTVGYMAGRMVVIAWTTRRDTRRIISMRKANERERRHYGSILGR